MTEINRNIATKRRRHYSQVEKTEIAALLKAGQSRQAVASQLGTSFEIVKKISASLATEPRVHPVELRLEGLRLIAMGETRKNVGKLLGVSEDTIAYWYKIGVKRLLDSEQEKAVREEKKCQIVEDVRQGKTDKQIAHKFQVTRASVTKIRHESIGIKYELVVYSDADRQRAVKLVEDGINVTAASKIIGCTPMAVRKWFDEAVARGKAVQPEKAKSAIEDIEFSWIGRNYPQYAAWQPYFAEWLKGENKALGQKIEAVTAFIRRYLFENKLPETPHALLCRGTLLPDFYETACPQSVCGVTRNNTVHQLLNWILLHHFSERSDDGHPTISPAFRNPVRKITHGGLPQKFESGYEPLPYGYIDQLRRKIVQGQSFRDWTWAQQALGRQRVLEEFEEETIKACAPDWFEVSEDQIDKNDPDCVWDVEISQTKGTRPILKMWSPVRWVALLLKLQIPARTFQVRFLDSGESDTWRYKGQQWAKNTNKLAAGTEKRPWNNGVLRRVRAVDGSESTTLYFNTNKTKDQCKSGADKGYECPWPLLPEIESQPHYWLEKLRDWQEKYNPIERRTAWSEVPPTIIGTAKSELQLASYSDACFLFRMPELRKSKRAHFPITDGAIGSTWYALLSGLEHDLAQSGTAHADGAPIVLVNPNSGTGTHFPLHCLRVSLITALAIDGGMPIALLMKVVGHSRLVMTLYYTKPSMTHIQDALTHAAEQIDSQKEKSIISFLANCERKELLERAIFNSSEENVLLVEENPSNRNPAGWLPLHHGVCLAGGNTSEVEGNFKIRGCHNGGPEIPGCNGRFGPVPGGVKNCVRCRWFVTEPHYVPALAAHLGNLIYHMEEARSASVKHETTWSDLKRHKADTETDGVPFTEMAKLKTAERLLDTSMTRFSNLASDMGACWRLIERCNAIADMVVPHDTTSLVATGDAVDVHAIIEETDSELLQLAGVCQNVEIYPDLDHGKAVFRRSQLLDAALSKDAIPPYFMGLSEDEQLKYGNLFIRKLVQRANANNPLVGIRKVCALIDAGQSLADLMGVDVNEFLLADQLTATNPRPLRLMKETRYAENEYSS